MKITIFAIRQDKAKFFLCVAKSLANENDISFVTTRYHTYRFFRKKCKAYMLQDFIDDSTEIQDCLRFKQDATVMERSCDFMSARKISSQFDNLCKGFKKYFQTNPTDLLLIWNGSMMQGYTASAVADLFNIKKIFFEVGNFPDKIFVDSQGVNAKSSLINKDLTLCGNYDEKKLMNFLNLHKQKKENLHLVPQAKTVKRLPFERLWDKFYNCFARYPIIEKQSCFTYKVIERYFKKVNIEYDDVDFQTHDYILFPLQVTTDSQILRNSDIDLLQSLAYALDDARSSNLSLFIKPHPAETNSQVLKYIYDLKKKNSNLYLVKGNTYQLIKHSKKVITINSTVGIEGLMYFKHVEIIGRAIYKKYCQPDMSKQIDIENIKRFLFNYFFNILQEGDFFIDKAIELNIEKYIND